MADETEEKTKQTVPALERNAIGVAAHAAAVQDRQWDKDRKVFRDPVIAMLALFTYAKLTASLLAEEEKRSAQKISALENRIAEFETRLTTLERWKDASEAQTAEMVKGVEAMIADGKMPEFIEQVSALHAKMPASAAATSKILEAPAIVVDGTVTPLKKLKKADDNKNGGTA